jgi:hypothetical protein
VETARRNRAVLHQYWIKFVYFFNHCGLWGCSNVYGWAVLAKKAPLIVDMGKRWNRGHDETHFSGVFYFANENAPKTHPLFRHFQTTTHATVKQAKAKKAWHDGCHWQSQRGSRGAILVGVAVSNVQKCHHSAVRTCVSQGTSPGTPRDKIQHYRSIVDRYKISEREGVDTLFYSKLNNIF